MLYVASSREKLIQILFILSRPGEDADPSPCQQPNNISVNKTIKMKMKKKKKKK